MKRVTGIGGVFFKSKDPKKLIDWYVKHLDVPIVKEGTGTYVVFNWKNQLELEKNGYTLWGPFKEDTKYMTPSKKEFMFNFTVENLDEILKVLREEGVQVFD